MKVVLYIALGIALAAPFGVLAQTNPFGSIDPSGEGVGAGDFLTSTAISADSMVTKIAVMMDWFAWFIALASVVMGLYAGFLFITARGEAAQLKTAHQTLFWAVVGIAVAVVSFSIILLTKTIFEL